MDNYVTISVGMPVYNAEKHIRLAIKSILNQTFTDFELIITDDGSTDNTVKIIKSFKDSRIKLYTDSQNRGIGFRLNQQINLASGQYFARMDADDLMFPNRLEIQLKYMQLNQSIDLIGGQAVVINDLNCIVGLRRVKEKYSFRDSVKHSIFIHPTIFGKLSWFKANLYDENYSGTEDHELYMRTYKNSSFCNLSEPVLFYRDGADFRLKTYLHRQNELINSFIKNKTIINDSVLVSRIISVIYVKSLFVKLLNFIRLEKILINNRNEKIDANELIYFDNILKSQIDSNG